MGSCVEKLPHSCGSSDGLQVFYNEEKETFSGFCFVCETYEENPYGDQDPPAYTPPDPKEIAAQVQEIINYPLYDLPSRRLREDSLRRFGVRMEVSQSDGVTPTLSYFPYGHPDTPGVVGWKARPLATKRMWSIGHMKGVLPFGWRQAVRTGSKTLYITEGEYDAIALYQILKDSNIGTAYQDMEHAVVSLPHGSSSAVKTISAFLQLIESHFDEVVLVFDQDKAGKKAAEDVSRIAPNFKVANLPCKDANDCLIEGASKAAKAAVVFRADKPKNSRIVYGSSLREAARKKAEMGLSWPWQGLTDATRGIRRGESIYFGAGVKMGKSELVNAIAEHLITKHNRPVYMIKPEEALAKSYKMILGKVAGKIFHDPNIPFDYDAFDKADAQVGDKAMFQDIYQFGRWDDLKSDITYAVLNNDVKDVIIDPITCFTNTMNSAEANEHLTRVAAELSAMAKDLDFTAYIFCHLKAPDGVPHERGGPVLSTQFAGSRAMMRSCNYMIGLEGNKDPDLPLEEKNVRRLKVLEDREFGVSTTVPLYWDHATGLFNEIR